MTSSQLFVRSVIYGVALGAIDAVSGRTLQASPEPSSLLALLATAWVAYDIAERRQTRSATPAAMTLWAAYFATFAVTAHVLVGWNNSVPWQPVSSIWVVWFAALAIVVAVGATLAGSRAANAANRTNPNPRL